MDKLDKLWIIVPCYNEKDVLPITHRRFILTLKKMKVNGLISKDSIVLFVDDGSKDDTWDIISDITNTYSDAHGLQLEYNVGQQRAMLAGLMMAKEHNADMAITIDCDGQDDLDAMIEMVKKYNSGYQIVYGVRNDRSSDDRMKRLTATAYYRLIKLFDRTMVYNHSEFRLMSNKVLQYLDAHDEKNLFLRKICSNVEYYENVPATSVYYKRNKREAGETKYTLKSLMKLAIRSIIPVKHKMGSVSHKNQYVVRFCTVDGSC